jgi:hypothetical protein
MDDYHKNIITDLDAYATLKHHTIVPLLLSKIASHINLMRHSINKEMQFIENIISHILQFEVFHDFDFTSLVIMVISY